VGVVADREDDVVEMDLLSNRAFLWRRGEVDLDLLSIIGNLCAKTEKPRILIDENRSCIDFPSIQSSGETPKRGSSDQTHPPRVTILPRTSATSSGVNGWNIVV
jgi:hypothetical protein